jgi:hypothetical protein
MHNNQINFCLVLLSKEKKKILLKIAENQVNHTNESKNIP